MRYLSLAVIVFTLGLTACSGNLSVGEVTVDGETLVEDYEVSFGEE